ncbi:4218_t:CDS:2 [Acaulospora colombiana]|uniref:4218_t:CDS:1 n=1 Tax=Acaulospora colombiana TaxID=27376 RepID=A0ACA9LK23_9GLOM|nr:4218_t:CDS:2 [Acaulospora colombiana]
MVEMECTGVPGAEGVPGANWAASRGGKRLIAIIYAVVRVWRWSRGEGLDTILEIKSTSKRSSNHFYMYLWSTETTWKGAIAHDHK